MYKSQNCISNWKLEVLIKVKMVLILILGSYM